jgi:hypothetical protein
MVGRGQSAAPQFAAVDLGPITIAGSGLAWQVVQPTPAPSYWPSTGGSACYGISTNEPAFRQQPIPRVSDDSGTGPAASHR